MTVTTQPPSPPIEQGPARRGAFVVNFNPTPTANVVAVRTRRLVLRVVSLVITTLLNVAFWWFTKDQPPWWRWWVIGLSMGVSVLYLVIAIIQLWRARHALKHIGHGEAFEIRRDGVVWDPDGPDPKFLPDDQITFIGTGGRAPVPGTNLIIRTRDDARHKVPLMYLDTLPGTLDGALRAYTSGAMHLDVTSLDAMLSPGAARPTEL